MHNFYTLLEALFKVSVSLAFLTGFIYCIIDKGAFSCSKEKIKRISAKAPILRIFSVCRVDYYYDEEFLYQMKKKEIIDKVPLKNIVKVKKTTTKLNNSWVWAVRYATGDYRGEKEFRFLNNVTLFNRDFLGFVEAVKAANPAVEI